MAVNIKYSQSYFWLDSWILANIIELGTRSFCNRFLDFRIDPGHRLFDQMVLAARCGVANIAEGSSRYSTSLDTEMRLIDVARASIDEVQGDFFSFLLSRNEVPWAIGNPDREAIWNLRMDAPQYSNSILHDAGVHILAQKAKFDQWIESDSADTSANAMLILCVRVNRMLHRQLDSLLEQFRQQGGFSENMTAERLEARRQQASDANAPTCPECGQPMQLRMQRRGQGQGRQFWGCINYPHCKGTRPYSTTPPRSEIIRQCRCSPVWPGGGPGR